MSRIGNRINVVEKARFDPPRITSSSIWLYHASDKLNIYRAIRFLEVPSVLYLAMFSSNPVAIGVGFAFLYFLGVKAFIWELIARTPMRIDFLPNVERVSVTKIGPFGLPVNTLWKLTDFERIDTFKEASRRFLKRNVVLE